MTKPTPAQIIVEARNALAAIGQTDNAAYRLLAAAAEEDMMYVVIIGDPFNGMRCYGPMDRIDAESLEADVYTDYEEPCCFIVKLHDPKELP